MTDSRLRIWSFFSSCGLLLMIAPLAAAQPRTPQMPEPPPMHLVSRSERTELDSAKDPKQRVRANISLAEDHLKEAENLTNQKEYLRAAEELGGYLGLIDDALEFISKFDSNKGSTRDLYRHLDIALRSHIPRLEEMRRATPIEYALNIKAAVEYARDARSEALDSFYGRSVLREPRKNKDEDKPKDGPPENKRP